MIFTFSPTRKIVPLENNYLVYKSLDKQVFREAKGIFKERANCHIDPKLNYRVFIKYCVFFQDFKIYSRLWPLSVSPRCQCVYTMAGQTPALAAELAEFRKIKTF